MDLSVEEVRAMGLYGSMSRLVIRKPWLLPSLLGLAWAARAVGWYRRPPFLPIPPAKYLRWRIETAYGDPAAVPPRGAAERYLTWASRMRRASRGGDRWVGS